MIWKRAELVDDLESFSNTKIAGRENIRSVQRKDKEHMRSPDADALDLYKVINDVLRRHGGERARVYGAILEFFSGVTHVFNFHFRKADRAELSRRHLQ